MPRTLLLALVLSFLALTGWLVSDLRAAGPVATAQEPTGGAQAPPTQQQQPPPPVQAPATAPPPGPEPAATASPPQTSEPAPGSTVPTDAATAAMPSVALGLPFRRGRLLRGVQLPETGPDFVSYDPPLRTSPSRPWRRWGTDVLVATLFRVLAEFRAANPDAPRILVGDLSRPRGGVFDRRFGGLGHASHQNGLDVDVFYPRRDRRLAAPRRPADVDRHLAQDLADRFLAAGAQVVFVGKRVGFRGIGGRGTRMQAIAFHDDHLHVRLPNPRSTK